MPIKILDQAIASSTPRPKGIKVGTELWKELNAAGHIQNKKFTIISVGAFEIELPCIYGDIIIQTAPEFGDLEYKLL